MYNSVYQLSFENIYSIIIPLQVNFIRILRGSFEITESVSCTLSSGTRAVAHGAALNYYLHP